MYTEPVHSTSVHRTSSHYKCTQNQFIVQVYTKPVHSASVYRTSSQYKCTQNQFTLQVFIETVQKGDHTDRHYKGEEEECTGDRDGTQSTINKWWIKIFFQYKCTQNQFTVQVCTGTVQKGDHTDGHYKWEECTGDSHYKWEKCTEMTLKTS